MRSYRVIAILRDVWFREISWAVAMVLVKGIPALLHLSAVKESYDHDSNLTSRPVIS